MAVTVIVASCLRAGPALTMKTEAQRKELCVAPVLGGSEPGPNSWSFMAQNTNEYCK